jgi:asparagine synthase (glutamine-hydrolysing)
MCGICGFLDYSKSNNKNILKSMTLSIGHRGPDHLGSFFLETEKFNLGFGHTRLSILDLSATGNQPMNSSNNRYSIIYNGEIYNFRCLKKKILDAKKNYLLQGSSDTEILLASIQLFGLDDTLNSIDGMFAFVLYDNTERRIYLVRDRFGEKPLYYSVFNINGKKILAFGSELKTLKSVKGWSGKLNKESIDNYFNYNYVKGPLSIYENTYQVPPHNYIFFEIDKSLETKKHKDWLIKKNVTIENLKDYSLENFDSILRKSISEKIDCDVPCGVFLSGGIDSSLIAAVANIVSEKKIKTFTIGFDQKNYNEANYAKKISKFLGTDHNEAIFSPEALKDIIPSLGKIYDEPFADISQLPLLILSKMTRHNVKVALSGDGGDELFGGYNRYLWFAILDKIPRKLRLVLQKIISTIPPDRFENFVSFVNTYLLKKNFIFDPGNKLEKLSKCINYDGHLDFYSKVTKKWSGDSILLDAETKKNIEKSNLYFSNKENFQEFMMKNDLKDYLINNSLVKIDRASMHYGLEVRLPLLSNDVVSFAESLPTKLKIKNNVNKIFLRSALKKYIPENLFNRNKAGFQAPIAKLLRTSLKSWAEDLLDHKKIDNQGILKKDKVLKLWQDHISNKKNNQNQLWTILVFQSWMQNQ